jgi:AcrR family transcriptional regulator
VSDRDGVAVSDDLGARIAGIQRSRLLAGALATVAEYGYEGMSVGRVTACAGVSRRTFYERFANREACFAALVDDAVEMVERELAEANLVALPWRERVRAGLWMILGFFDREPRLARVCVVHTLCAGPQTLERRQRILARLALALDEGRTEGSRTDGCTRLTAECMVGGILAIVQASLMREESEPLVDLFGDLIGTVLLPYLGARVARHERDRPPPAAVVSPRERFASAASGAMGEDLLREMPMRVTYRTARVLESIAERPGISNREVGDCAGVTDQGQISKLMARLERLGLTTNTSVERPAGGVNAWQLTQLGERLTERLGVTVGHSATTDRSAMPIAASPRRPRARRY